LRIPRPWMKVEVDVADVAAADVVAPVALETKA
jgi:hypothetical protein